MSSPSPSFLEEPVGPFSDQRLCVQALSVGIFPYVLKLLQSSARELRPLLVFIWAKILAVDSVSRGQRSQWGHSGVTAGSQVSGRSTEYETLPGPLFPRAPCCFRSCVGSEVPSAFWAEMLVSSV